jgi:hypothetical protein
MSHLPRKLKKTFTKAMAGRRVRRGTREQRRFARALRRVSRTLLAVAARPDPS